jgi:hypothetical protein
MSDYSWIKPGVKAVIINNVGMQYPQTVGEIVIIAGSPRAHLQTGESVVDIEDWEGMKSKYGLKGFKRLVVNSANLKPYKDDDDSRDITTWDEITRIIGVDITAP